MHAKYQNNKFNFRSELEIRRRINLLVKEYIDFTNDILAKYSFSRDGSILQLYVKRIKQLSHTEGCSILDAKYCEYSESLHNLLVSHSLTNHNDVCLSYIFTYQHLSDSTIGLAWKPNINTADEGGMCAKYHEVLNDDPEDPQLEWRSHNTGVMNLAKNHRELPDTVAKLAFVHEIGHSIGSVHDYPEDCQGDDVQGNYLMHKSGVRGYLQNNYKLSKCSYHNITFFFSAMKRQDRDCLDPKVPQNICGNGIVEGWEDCDCGESTLECKEKCCYPADHRNNPCLLKSRKVCSPSAGGCCSPECEFLNDETECSDTTECKYAAKCTGKSNVCPIPLHKSDTSECEDGSKICKDGVCSASICGKFNMVECTLKDASPCQIHCQAPNRPETCQPSDQLDSLFPEPVYRPFGAPCDMVVEEEYALGSCSASAECVGGPPTLGSSSWAVGLGIALICILVFNGCAIWIYCKYCRGSMTTKNNGQETNQSPNQLVLKPNSDCD